jgi:hypothetical protein
MKLNVVHGFGFFYWIVRDTGNKNTPKICIGWTREIGGYWRKGKGPQIRFGKYLLQFGLCKKNKVANEQDGILRAVEGRILELTTKEISTWR